MMKRNGETLKNRERCKEKSLISSEKRENRVLKGKTENKWKLEFEIKKNKENKKWKGRLKKYHIRVNVQ